MDNQQILLVNLPKGILGEAPSALLAAFIVAHLQKAALARADRGSSIPFYLYLDEFQNYTTDNIKDILSESRKYALSLTLAHQYLDQLPGELRSAVLNTAGTLVSFRVGYHDATQLAKEIFPSPDYIQQFKTSVTMRHSYQVPLPFISSKSES
jgi:type IV secretory pathway TraG/TraD family ATPase VirD4